MKKIFTLFVAFLFLTISSNSLTALAVDATVQAQAGVTSFSFSNTEEYKAMISKSLLNKGNNYRLKNAIEKAQRGEDVTIAYIGGSVTQGAGADPLNTNCYAYQSYLRFKEMFGTNGGENIHFVKSGVGGTPSELGIVRYDRDILRDGTVKPDIVIIEYAVNDADDETKGDCYESLALKALSADNNPAVILLFAVFKSDWNLQDRLEPVGTNYNLPMVSIKDALVEQFETGSIISKEKFFYDAYHPTNDGHKIMADCIANLFAEAQKSNKDAADINLNVEPYIGNSFVNMHLIDKKDNKDGAIIVPGGFTETDDKIQGAEIDDKLDQIIQFPNNWMHTASSGNESFKMTVNSKNLILVSKDSSSNDFGKADVYVDGQLVNTIDTHVVAWDHCHPYVIYQEEVAKEHSIEIKMASGDEGKNFTILGFGYSK